MKKVYKLLLLIILCFSFIGSVQAEDAYYTAIYRNKYTKSSEQPDVQFAIYDPQIKTGSKYLYARPAYDFTYLNETKGPSDIWSSNNKLIDKDSDIKLILDGDIKKIDFKEENYKNKKYFYYDITNNRNKLYLSNEKINKNDIDYDLMFERIPDYKDSEPNAILDSIMCTYGGSKNQNNRSSVHYVSIEMVRTKLGTLEYQVYLDFQPMFAKRKEIQLDYEGYDAMVDHSSFAATYKTYLTDHFSPRNFWDESTGVLGCPSGIVVGSESTIINNYTSHKIEIGWKEVMDKEYSNEISGLGSHFSFEYDFVLYENSSYVEYQPGLTNTQTCVFSTEVCDPTIKDCDENWEVTLKEVYYLDGKQGYDFYHKNGKLHSSFDDIYYDYTLYAGLIKDTCDTVDVIYTNCFNGDMSHQYYKGYGAGAAYIKVPTNQCIVSRNEFPGSEKFLSNKYIDEFDRQTVEESMGEENGIRFRQHMCAVKPMLNALANSYDPSKITELKGTTKLDFYSKTSKEKVSYNITEVPCSTWGIEEKLECDSECMQDLDYATNKKLREVFYYCNDIKKEYLTYEVNEEFNNGRYQECKKFEEFYDSLVANGILTDIFTGCDFITDGLRNKLEFILDLIKIIGPVMAIVLGMLDFGKVVIAGDPDKEMKPAGKRFLTRVMAAALLFLIPALISIPLNVVLKDKVESSPLCDLDKRSS